MRKRLRKMAMDFWEDTGYLFGRKKVKITINCPHGEFVQGSYTPNNRGDMARYSCDECKFLVKLVTYRGPINW